MTTANSPWSATLDFEVAGLPYPQDEMAKLLASDGAANDGYGGGIGTDWDGGLVLIGAMGKGGKGAVYAYQRSGNSFTYLATITADDGVTGDQFGRSISMSGDGTLILIGANGAGMGGSTQGAVYVYQRSGTSFVFLQKLTASDLKPGAYFGTGVALSSDGVHAIIGAWGDSDKAQNAGAFYYFRRSNNIWMQIAKVYSSDPAAYDQLGRSLAMSADGTKAYVGAPHRSKAAIYGGSVFTFTRVGDLWTQVNETVSPSAAANAVFGYGVACSADGNTVFVGESFESPIAVSQGSVYVFDATSGSLVQKSTMKPSDAITAVSDAYGYGVAVSGTGLELFIGRNNTSLYQDGRGAVYNYA